MVPSAHPPRSDVGPGRVLAVLTTVQHLLFGVLLVVTTFVALRSGAAPAWVIAGVALSVVWYIAGRWLASRVTGRGVGWLLGLAVCWLLLVVVSPAYAWLGFALWLLAGHFLTLPWAVVFVGLALLVVLGAPVLAGDPWTIAGVTGPTVGALFALGLSRGEHHLVRDAVERADLIRSLVRAQAETEELHAELAAAQRESGALSERTRLSRDIHDSLAQGFSSILLFARAGRLADEHARREALIRIEETAAAHLDEARRVVGALAPRDLTEGGLAAALRRQLEGLGPAGPVGELRTDGDVASIPTTTEVALLRTAQGALANVRTHASASRVVVTLARTEDSVLLDVVDDGCGFESDDWAERAPLVVSRGGYGLRATRSRLRELGGDLEVTSSPGDGTALSAWLPLPFRQEGTT